MLLSMPKYLAAVKQEQHEEAGICQAPSCLNNLWLQLMSGLGYAVLVAHHILVEHRKTDKEGNADQVLNGLDVLVEINQGVDRSDMAYGIEKC